MSLLTQESPAATAALDQVRAALQLIMDEEPDRTRLTDWLYARWWCGPGLAFEPEPADPETAARGASRLEAARRSVAPTSPGWLVLAAVSGQLVAARLPSAGLGTPSPGHRAQRIRTTPESVVTSSRPGRPARPGDLVALRSGQAGLDPTGGWWWAHTGRPEELTSGRLDRWYVHAKDLAAASRLLPVLLQIAAETGVDVSLKCPPVRSGYGRRDALVVYLPRDRAPGAEAALRGRAALVAAEVRPDVPPLTRLLLPGVGHAEDPGTGDTDEPISYGQLRCQQVAAVADRLLGPALRVPEITDDTIRTALAEVGIDPAAAHRVQP